MFFTWLNINLGGSLMSDIFILELLLKMSKGPTLLIYWGWWRRKLGSSAETKQDECVATREATETQRHRHWEPMSWMLRGAGSHGLHSLLKLQWWDPSSKPEHEALGLLQEPWSWTCSSGTGRGDLRSHSLLDSPGRSGPQTGWGGLHCGCLLHSSLHVSGQPVFGSDFVSTGLWTTFHIGYLSAMNPSSLYLSHQIPSVNFTLCIS